ncbi:phospholipase A1-Igamma1, chloroplastic [Cynara cardunculus var. scolymus]|uniref:Lipase, class 3 n=1 Tax=Cynara cardunculus var. scolymus TaxID=59895 RepID=A0A103U6G3_CYNCS|nr:phospholipase A1-Igamma1, chloroplastic [Cynara cardunculus var. scolymus]KVH29766.1 Lipase, class 3 [Cynara cardunculus var. scolymus]
MAVATTVNYVNHRCQRFSSANDNKNLRRVTAYFNDVAINDGDKRPNKSTRLAKSISNLLHLYIEKPSLRNFLQRDESDAVSQAEAKLETPTMSPKEDISRIWRDIHGGSDWESLLDPLHPLVRREIIKYGEFAQATYDAFDFDSFSEYCGSCLFNRRKLFEKLGLTKHGYDVSKYLYAMSQFEIPRWLEKSYVTDTWSKDSNWMGYVAVSDDVESRRIGRRDIVVSWRGTVLPSEWYEDMQQDLEPLGHGEAKVERGFLSIYKSKSISTRYNKKSASEQVMEEVKRLMTFYKEKGEQISLTITGHSLGGALALLNAYEAAMTFPTLPISVISFGAPRVGNIAFRDEMHHMSVKTLRVTIKQDLVPRMPGIVFNETLQKFDDLTGTLEWVYHHVGAELKLDVRASPFLKRGSNFIGIHHPETYLHLVDGYVSSTSSFRSDAKRDVALVNKYVDMLVNDLRIPPCWYQLSNKGLVSNKFGRWVRPKREPENIPSPIQEESYDL